MTSNFCSPSGAESFHWPAILLWISHSPRKEECDAAKTGISARRSDLHALERQHRAFGDCIRRAGGSPPAILCWRCVRPGISPACVHAGVIRTVCRAVLLIPAPLSALRARKRRRLLDRQRDLDSIQRLRWKDFESFLGEYYRRRVFSVEENRQGGADGGVDLRLRDRNGLHVVQCKQWLKRPVSVSIVRELYGVMVDQGAYRGSVVTSGTFTEEAEQFAEGKPMELVDGERLERMIREVGGAKAVSSHPPNTPSADRVTECPRCGSPLILRKARRGRQKDRSSMAARRFRNAVMSGPRCEARRSPEHARYARATRSRSIESVAHQRSPRVDLRAGMTPWARARLRDGPWPQACRVGAGASTSACARMADLQASTRRRLV